MHARQIERRLGQLVPGLLALFVLSALHARPPPVRRRPRTGRVDRSGCFRVRSGYRLALGAALAHARSGSRSGPGRHRRGVDLRPTDGPGAVALFTLVVFRARTLRGPIAVGVSAVTLALLVIVTAVTGHSTPRRARRPRRLLRDVVFGDPARGRQRAGKATGGGARAQDVPPRRAPRRWPSANGSRARCTMSSLIRSRGCCCNSTAPACSQRRPGRPAARAGNPARTSPGRSGLDEARRAIAMLRGDELPGPERLPALTAQFEHDTRSHASSR